MGESNNDVDDALDLEEGFKNALLERQSEVDGMAQLLLVKSQGGYHHVLPIIGHRRLLK